MAAPDAIPPEAVAVVRRWCRGHQGLVAWCGARCERPGAYPVDLFVVLQDADEDTRERLAFDLHEYLQRGLPPADADAVFVQLSLSREELVEELTALGVAAGEVGQLWPE